MSSVRAFQPRQYDPPQFVAFDEDELPDRVGEYIGGGQCDGCGCGTYRIERNGNFGFQAVCAVDPTDDPEFAHPAPCGTAYRILLYEEDMVTF